MLDEFYPESEVMARGIGMWVAGFEFKIQEHLRKAKAGDRVAESKLCNRMGQLCRHHKDLTLFPESTLVALKEVANWLRSTGRKVDFSNPDPRFWITTRSGNPRW